MKAVTDFLNMGGYGAYVWSSYLFGLVVFGGHWLWNKIRRRTFKRQLRRFVARENIE